MTRASFLRACVRPTRPVAARPGATRLNALALAAVLPPLLAVSQAWAQPASAPAAGAAAPGALAYVSNQSGDLSVIDLATLQTQGTLKPHGGEPRGLGVTADGKLLVVANRKDGAVAVIDRVTGQLVRKVTIGKNPEFVRVRGRLAFVSFEPSSSGKPPGAGGKDDDDDKDAGPAQVAVVDLDQGRVLRSIVGGRETEGIEFSADGRQILVTNEADDTVTVHAIDSGKLLRTIDLKPHGTRPRGIKRSPDGSRVVVTLEHSNNFVVLGPDLAVEKTVKTGESPYGVAFDRSGRRLFVAAARSEKLQVYDTGTWTLAKEVPVGKRCWHFTFTPDDRRVLLACGRSSEVVVIDAATLEVTARVPDKQLPWGIVTYPKSVGSLDAPE